MRKILIIHPKCCIRAIKQIEGLLSTGSCSISLITHKAKYLEKIPDEIKNQINIINFRFRNNYFKRLIFKIFLKNIVFNYNLIHCHNEPNYYIVDVLKVVKNQIPVVYDIHDFTSMRSGVYNKNEAFAYKNSNAIIHVNNDFIEYGNNLYGKKNCFTIYSTPSKKYKYKYNEKKIRESLHFVYQGGIYDKEFDLKRTKPRVISSYRNYLPYFTEILEEGHHVHLFTATNPENLPGYMKLNEKFSKFHFHGCIDYKQLLKKMNEFDFGITGFNFDDIKEESAIKYLNFAMGNKLFDYIFSGVKPIVVNADSMADFVKENKCGYVKENGVSWSDTIKKLDIDNNIQTKIVNEYCIENQIQNLLSVYDSLLK